MDKIKMKAATLVGEGKFATIEEATPTAKALVLLEEAQEKSKKDNEATIADQVKVKVDEATKLFQKQLDEANLNSQKGAKEVTFKSVKDKIVDDLSEKSDDLAKFASGENTKGVSLTLNLKADEVTVAASFTGNVIQPAYVPGIFAGPSRKHIRDFIAKSGTNSDNVPFVQETGWVNNAGPVLDDGATKYGQSKFTLAQKDGNVRTISTFLKVHRNILSDMPALGGFIANRGTQKLLNAEDTQLIYGTGVAPQLRGLMLDATAYDIANAALVAKTRYDVLMAAITQGTIGEYYSNVIFLHQREYQQLRTLRDANGAFLFPQNQPIEIDGVRIEKSTAMLVDDFLCADTILGAEMFIREGINVSFHEEDEDNVQKGLVTVRLLERVVLNNYAPAAFIKGKFSTAMA